MSNEGYLPVMPEAEEFLDGDIDRSEFDKYLSGGYGVNHVTNISCSFYGAGGPSVGPSEGAASAAQFEASNKELAAASSLQHANGNNDYMVMKSEATMHYESIPATGSSLSSALADVRSVYYDC